MRVLFLNQYFPPDPAPTGILLRQIGDRLAAAGHEVEYVDAAQNYWERRRGFRRIARELGGLARIFLKGTAAARPDVVFSASSPPCLFIAAALVARRHGARSIHWAMDLYPELAETLGEIPPPAARLVECAAGPAYRATDLVVGLDADMVERLRKYRVGAESLRPWILDESPLSPELLATPPSDRPEWLYSGNLGRAHEWRTLLEAQRVLERRGAAATLVFQGAGPSLQPASECARELGLVRCEFRDYAPPAHLVPSLLAARVLVATQRPETKGLLWPSKLALLVELPRPMLWIGPADGAVAAELRERPGTGIFPPGEAAAVADWVEAALAEKTRPHPPSGNPRMKEDALHWWQERIERLIR